ncbi:myelin-associated glycoprotein-like [Conger conger]|uniref:myelin-associated glycoprotein-like n=1 Tax=Conger conger TaxID=82655 RepID=UPI002A59FB3D|nr:myelin-associated glycoprotein-like [Conger conger]
MIGAERLILIGCLLQGALGREWAVWMPQSIEALSGSCVLIPCRFEMPEYNYDYRSTYDNLLKHNPDSVTGLWRKNRTTVFNSRSQSTYHLKGRMTGNLLQKSCTTVLENLPNYYSDQYYFRLETYYFQLNFHPAVQINIKDSPPKPKLTPEKVEVMEGTSVSLSCSAAAPCPKLPPNLTWTPRLSDSVDQLQENEDKTKSVSSDLTFTAFHVHHGQKVTCRALYTLRQGGNQMSEASLILTVLYMPQISGSGSCSRTAAEISCSCESRGNPSPSMEWRVSGLRVTNSTDRVIREEQLGNTGLRSSLTMRHSQGDTATLLCLSTNALGTSSLQLCVPSPQQHSGVHLQPLVYVIIAALICLNVLTVGFCLHKNKRLSRRLKGGRDGDTYASLQLANISPEYDVLQVKNKHQKDTVTAQEEADDYQNTGDGN